MGTDRIASGKCIGGDQPRLAYSLSLCRFKSWRTPAVFAGSSETLQECSEIRNLKVSKLMETAPYGYTEQPAFLNGAIELETLFTPQELLIVIHKIEAELGRERVIHWGPRTIDLDIVFYDDEIVAESELIIPHIDMQNRLFVLEPLYMLCPGKVHPVLHKTVAQLRQELISKTQNKWSNE